MRGRRPRRNRDNQCLTQAALLGWMGSCLQKGRSRGSEGAASVSPVGKTLRDYFSSSPQALPMTPRHADTHQLLIAGRVLVLLAAAILFKCD